MYDNYSLEKQCAQDSLLGVLVLTFNRLSVVPGQGEVVARRMRSEAFTLHISDWRKALNRVDLPTFVHPTKYTSPVNI